MLIGLETLVRINIDLATFSETLSGSFSAITFGTISPITNVRYVLRITTTMTLMASLYGMNEIALAKGSDKVAPPNAPVKTAVSDIPI